MGTEPNDLDTEYYEIARPNSMAEGIVIKARDRIYEDFMRTLRPSQQEKIVDIGVSQVVSECANVLERKYPYPRNITACGIGRFSEFQIYYPGVTYVQIEENEGLPFEDDQFDIATSNAVLEHVGSPENQARFVAELARVARRVFLTVPHRFFPFEHHTGLPLLHYTDTTFRLACFLLGKTTWTEEENLILMSKSRLESLVPINVRKAKVGYTGLNLGLLSSNLYLFFDR